VKNGTLPLCLPLISYRLGRGRTRPRQNERPSTYSLLRGTTAVIIIIIIIIIITTTTAAAAANWVQFVEL